MGKPDWRENLLARIDERPSKRNRTVGDQEVIILQMRVPRAYTRLLDKAAQKRGVGRSAFLRRATAILVASTLSLPLRDVLHMLPAPLPWGGNALPGKLGRDQGVGIEEWCPHPRCDGSHFD